MSSIGQYIDREWIEKAVSECGHIVMNGRCFQEVKATLPQTALETTVAKDEIIHWLITQGFDPEVEIQRDRDIFKGDFTFYQLRPIACEKHDTRTVEGLRRWMKDGCPA